MRLTLSLMTMMACMPGPAQTCRLKPGPHKLAIPLGELPAGVATNKSTAINSRTVMSISCLLLGSEVKCSRVLILLSWIGNLTYDNPKDACSWNFSVGTGADMPVKLCSQVMHAMLCSVNCFAAIARQK